MRNKAILGAVVAALLAIGAGWYFYSPHYTLSQMRSAAEANDADKLASYIDFPALRTSMKEQVKAKMASELMTKKTDGFEALGAAFAMNMIDGMVDGIVTPSGLRAVFLANKELAGKDSITAVDGASPDLKVTRTSFDSFAVHEAKGQAGKLIFKRDGLGWKLSEMQMPGGGPTI